MSRSFLATAPSPPALASRPAASRSPSVQRAFRELAEEHRQILFLCAVEDLKYREVAAILNLPIGTVRSRLSRARAAMRLLLWQIQRADAALLRLQSPPN
jgi:DNA-directed RNA polymerase specialized sigma24 family protein